MKKKIKKQKSDAELLVEISNWPIMVEVPLEKQLEWERVLGYRLKFRT